GVEGALGATPSKQPFTYAKPSPLSSYLVKPNQLLSNLKLRTCNITHHRVDQLVPHQICIQGAFTEIIPCSITVQDNFQQWIMGYVQIGLD
ncbi:hypothetical protein LOZ66_006969, partial [Ophidiomyces ophidiicola]